MRDTANVYQATTGEAAGTVELPAVLTAPIRPDHVRYIHTQMAKNARQAYAISSNSGYQTSAASWGTGRAVARIPRVSGGGTHRAGQAAFGNMCRGGGMYSPTKTYRRWHRCINITEKRHAVASALSAACVASIVMARGHKIDAVNEVPCIVSDEIEQVQKTKQAIEILKKLGCGEELVRIEESKTQRAGRGKLRGRRVVIRRGPLIVYSGSREQMNAFRNIPGVDLCHVERLNLLQLAPGGSLGRFIIYSKSALEQLGNVWASKSGYTLPRPIMANADVARVINSDEIQSVLRPKLIGRSRRTQHKNLLTNHAVRCRVNPGYKVRKLAAKKN